MTTLRRSWPLVPIACLLLATAVGMGRQQPQAIATPADPAAAPAPLIVTMPAVPTAHLAVAGPLPPPPHGVDPAATPALTPAQDKPTIDQLIDQLERLRAQKAELDRQEKAVVEKLREAVARQKDRLAKLGVEPGAAAGPVPAPIPPPADTSPERAIGPAGGPVLPSLPGSSELPPPPRK